ncbi:MAG: hypothetical protein K2K27_08540 [Muribaculaceae bacterium]|nr:hypothetical protein [Muribaculaceae bacterium]
MKSFTFRKKWNEFISEMVPEKRTMAIVCVYDFVMNGNKPDNIDVDCQALLDMVEKDLERAAKSREKARERREKLKIAQQRVPINDNEPFSQIENSLNLREYQKYPALYMFDGFMKYLAMARDVNERLDLPENFDPMSMMKKFRSWAIEHNRLNEISKLTSFVGLFRHAFPDFMPYVLIA